MDWRALFKGSYLVAVEFGGREPTFMIRGVDTINLEQEDGQTKPKAIVFFDDAKGDGYAGCDRGWVLCKTSAMCIAAMFGNETDAWIGKRVTLYATDVQVGKEKKPGIRVKGSPDIKAPITTSVKLPKKKAFSVTLTPTVKRTATQQQTDDEARAAVQRAKPTPEPQPNPRPLPLNASTPPANTGNASDAANLMDKLRDFTW